MTDLPPPPRMPPPPPPPPPPSAHLPPPPPAALAGAWSNVAPVAAGPHPVLAQNVSKWFGDLVAVSDISFSIGRGVTALLGPNGAGKSTMMRMLCGLTAPSQGTIRILDRDPRADIHLARQIGIVPQQDGIFESLTAFEFVRLAGILHEIDDPAGAARDALAIVELDPDDKRKLPTYSKGMRQRVKVAQALVHDPQVVFLDEPLEGLDPRQRISMIGLFIRLGNEGRTVIVSSHVLDEVERFGSQVIVIAQGRLAAEGDFRAIREQMDDRPHRIRVGTDDPRRLAAALLESGAVTGAWMQSAQSMVVDTVDAPRFRRAVMQVAAAKGLGIDEVAPLDDDLESVFRYLVGRR